jgi:hypothetical protein
MLADPGRGRTGPENARSLPLLVWRRPFSTDRLGQSTRLIPLERRWVALREYLRPVPRMLTAATGIKQPSATSCFRPPARRPYRQARASHRPIQSQRQELEAVTRRLPACTRPSTIATPQPEKPENWQAETRDPPPTLGARDLDFQTGATWSATHSRTFVLCTTPHNHI